MAYKHLILSADKPIREEKEDLLGRARFARAVAAALAAWRQDESLVVGVYGPWGDGKTSVKNLVVKQIGATSPTTVVVEYNPWLWSSRDKMLAAFYREIGIALGNLGGKRGKGAAQSWEHYSNLMQLGGTVAEYLKTALDVTGLGIAGITAGAVSNALKKGATVSKQAATVERATKPTSVRKIKEELSVCLKKLDVPLLVVIDDIDRLTPDEIRLLFQLIKANADFPNLIYLLLFDRGVVEAALTQEGMDGSAYMEKIVQVGLNLPVPRHQDIARVLQAGLETLLQIEGAEQAFSKERWQALYHYSLQHLFRTVRDVRRFLSSLSFQVGLFHNSDTLEINLVDLIGMETIRQYASGLYERLPSERGLLLGRNDSLRYLRDKAKEKEIKSARVASLLELVEESIREPIGHALTELFPELSEALGRPHLSEPSSDLRAMLRIADESFFDRYFVFGVPLGDIPQARINQLVSTAEDRQLFAAGLISFADEGTLRAALMRLEPQIPKLPISQPVTVIAAFFDMGEHLSGEQLLLEMGDGTLAYIVLGQYLKRLSDRETRSRAFLDAMKASSGVYLPSLMLNYESEANNSRFGKDGLLDEGTIAKAKIICGRRVSSLLKRGSVSPAKLVAYFNYLERWRKKDVLPHKRRMLKTPQGALQLLRMHSRTISSTRTGWRLEIRLADIMDIGVEPFRRTLSPLLKRRIDDLWQPLAKQEVDVLEAFKRALERQKAGQPDVDIE